MIKIDSGSDYDVCMCVCVCLCMCVCVSHACFVGNLLHLILNVCMCGREVIICT